MAVFRLLPRGAIRAAIVVSALLTAAPALATDPCADWVPQPKPQNVGRDIVGQDLDTILDRGFIEFAVYEDFPPWSWEDKGRPRGVDIEIGHLIAGELGVEPRFKFVTAAENQEADLRNWLWRGPVVGGSVANVMLHVPIDSAFMCRVEQVVFTGAAYVQSIAIAYDMAAYPEDPPLPAYFRFDTVGVENDSISDFYLSALAGGQLLRNMRRYPSTKAAVDAVGAGEVLAAMGPRGELQFELPEGVAVHQPPLPGFGVGQWTVGVGVNFRYRPLAYAVGDAIYAARSDGRLAAIFAGYGLEWTEPDR